MTFAQRNKLVSIKGVKDKRRELLNDVRADELNYKGRVIGSRKREVPSKEPQGQHRHPWQGQDCQGQQGYWGALPSAN